MRGRDVLESPPIDAGQARMGGFPSADSADALLTPGRDLYHQHGHTLSGRQARMGGFPAAHAAEVVRE